MLYLESFSLPSADNEDTFVLSYPYQLEMQCYTHNVYPFKIFPQKKLRQLEFAPVTMLCGGNGSGKSTLLNIIAEKLRLERSAPFNNTPYFEDYLSYCRPCFARGSSAPSGSKLIASDDVFDMLLDLRAINAGIADRREKLFEEYYKNKNAAYSFKSLDDYEALKLSNEAKRHSKSEYVSKRLPKEVSGGSNGESAFAYFAHEIVEGALYLLDEPENSLSVKLQKELLSFIEDSVRFFGCQFIISTHSPVLLSMRGAKIYDLDSVPVSEKKWTELPNIREWFEFFESFRESFL